MRRVLLVALLVLSAVSGTSAAASQSATLSGTVTTEDGTTVSGGYVLVQNASETVFREMTAERTVQETFLKMAHADIEGVRVAPVDEQGRYSVSLPPGEYDVVGVTEARLSGPIRDLTVRGETTRDVAVGTDAVVRVEGEDVTVGAGNGTTLRMRVHNPDDGPARDVSVAFETPEGIEVSVANATGSPTYDSATRRFTWDAIRANGTVSVAFVVDVPEKPAQGRYELSFAGRSETRFVETVDDAAVSLPRGPTPTAHPIGDGGTETHAESPTLSPSPHTDGDGPGFGAVAGLLALVLAGLPYRRQA